MAKAELDKAKKATSVPEPVISLRFGKDLSVTLTQDGITLKAPDHSVQVASDGVSITGKTVTIEATTLNSKVLDNKIQAVQSGLDQKIQKAVDAALYDPYAD